MLPFVSPGFDTSGGLVAFVHFIQRETDECIVYYGNGAGECVIIRTDTIAQERTSGVFQTFV